MGETGTARLGTVHLRRDAKASVFTDLFGEPRYLLELYRELHPEDTQMHEQDLELVTAQNVLTHGRYNDLGFAAGGRLIILVEAQSTWNRNMPLRMLFYCAKTLERYVAEHELDLHRPGLLSIPRPEFYVVYTGKRRVQESEMSLSQSFLDGRIEDGNTADAKAGSKMSAGECAKTSRKRSDLELTVHVLGGESEGIIGQYVFFAHRLDEQRRLHGSTPDAVRNAIRICRERGVLDEYLAKREEEVVDIMITLFDEDEVMRAHDRTVRQDAFAQGEAKGEKRGVAKGVFGTLCALLKTGAITTAQAAETAGMSEQQFIERAQAFQAEG